MSWVAVAIGGSALLGFAGSAMQSNAAQSAANTQAQAAENAQNISLQEFNTITGQEQPYMQSGYGAQSQLNYLLGIGTPGTPYSAGTSGSPGGYNARRGSTFGATAGTPGTPGTASSSPYGTFGSLLQPFTASYMQQYSPAYKFQLQLGQQGVLNQDASSQGAESGAALKDLIGFNQNYANTAFNSAFNQYQAQQGNTYQRLAGIAQLGQAAAANTGQQGTALAGQAAQSATNIGTALGAGQVGSANAWAGGLSNLGSLAAFSAMNQAGGFNPYYLQTQAGNIQAGSATDPSSGLGYVTPGQ